MTETRSFPPLSSLDCGSHLVAANNSALTQLCVDGAVGASLVTAQPAHSVRVFKTLKSCA